ncbi:MAG: PKD domain-containing protein, partial [Catalinimonas sp.]
MTTHSNGPQGHSRIFLGWSVALLFVWLGGVMASSTPKPGVALSPLATDTIFVNLGPNDTVVCGDAGIVLVNLDSTQNGAELSRITYEWSTGETTSFLQVDSVLLDTVNCFQLTATLDVDGDPLTTDDIIVNSDRIFVTYCGQAREEAVRWHFGGGAGLDFTGGAAAPNTDATLLNTQEGVAVANDFAGQFLFYSDGRTVYTRAHQVMPTTGSVPSQGLLAGDEDASQAALIVPQKADCKSCPTRHYVFTVDAVGPAGVPGNINYTVVDMDGNADGQVIADELNVPLLVGSTERIAAVENPQDSTYWIIGKVYGTNEFQVYHLTENGLADTTVIAAGSVHDAPAEAEGYMKASVDGDRLAVAFTDPANDFIGVELFRFDNETGTIDADPDSVIRVNVLPDNPLPDDTPLRAYGVEFANGGNLLYVSVVGPDSSLVYRYDISGTDSAAVAASRDLVFREVAPGAPRRGALQAAPDGKIYVAVEGAAELDVIDNPGASLTDDPGYQAAAQTLGGPTSGLGLPNFVNTFVEPPPGSAFSYVGSCTDEPVEFQGGRICPPLEDTYAWDFGGGAPASTEQNPSVVFNNSGSYSVTLTITNDCKSEVITQTVTIAEKPDAPTVQAVINDVCDSIWTFEIPSGDFDGASFEYAWSGPVPITVTNNGRTVEIDRSQLTTQGTFSLNVFNRQNPTCAQTVNPAFTAPPFVPFQATLNDAIFCTGTPLVLTPQVTGGTPLLTYRWSRVGGGNNLSTSASFTVPRPGTYRVEVTNADGCTAEAEADVTGLFAPDIPNPSITPAQGCPDDPNAPTGAISVALSGSSFTYQWFGPDGNLVSTSPGVTDAPAGTYELVLTYGPSCDTVYRFDVPFNPLLVALEAAQSPVTADCQDNLGTIVLTGVG